VLGVLGSSGSVKSGAFGVCKNTGVVVAIGTNGEALGPVQSIFYYQGQSTEGVDSELEELD
jgi:hypothetical protein